MGVASRVAERRGVFTDGRAWVPTQEKKRLQKKLKKFGKFCVRTKWMISLEKTIWPVG